MASNYSRREFFNQLFFLGAGLYMIPFLQSCDSKNGIRGSAPFSTWKEILQTLSESPDNFPSRRDQLVLEKDPEAMFNFVRNELTLLPTDQYYFRYISNTHLYGTKQALRCGMATPREKADILKEMLVDAGFEARVISESIQLSEARVKNILFKKSDIQFDPPIPNRLLRKWHKELGIDQPSGTVNNFDDLAADSKIFADKLLEIIPEDLKKKDKKTAFHFGQRAVPGVAFKQNNEEVILHLFDPLVPYGSLHPTNAAQKVYPADDVSYKDSVISISLKGVSSRDQSKEIPLIEAEYKASELLGNQLHLQFLNNLTFEEQVTMDINAINSYTPCISLQDMEKDEEYLSEKSVLGEPIYIDGTKVLKDAILYEETSAGRQAGNVSDVSSFKLIANPKVYPKVELELYPLDSRGNVVEGLSASNFKISSNEKAMRGFMRQNLVAPRILLLYDISGSMPSSYRHKGIETFLDQTQKAIKESFPHAQIRLLPTLSNIYTSHVEATQNSGDLILYATDGHNSDSFKPEYRSLYDSGPPTVYLNVNDSPQKLFQQVIENTGAVLIPAKDQEKTIAEIERIVSSLSLPSYIFYLNTHQREPHELKVELKNTDFSVTSEITFPNEMRNVVGNRLISLILDVAIDKRKLPRRILAGWDSKIHPRKKSSIDMANEVHEMMLGQLTFAFETAGATTSVRFSEYITALLSTENWMKPYMEGDVSLAVENFQKGGFFYPSVLLSAMQPIENSVDEETATFVEGIRIGLLKFKPALHSEKSVTSFDFMRSSKYRTLTKDGQNWWSANLRKTSQLALLESKLFANSTLTNLLDKKLAYSRDVWLKEPFTHSGLGDDYYYWSEYVIRRGKIGIVDSQGEEKAFWSIDSNLGELYGILPDLSGGSAEGLEVQLKSLQKVVDEYSKVLSALNIGMMATGGGMALGVVAAYSLTLVRLYAYASEAIIIMDASLLNEHIGAALGELACNIYKEILYSKLGSMGTSMGGLENLIGAMGGNFSFVECQAQQ